MEEKEKKKSVIKKEKKQEITTKPEETGGPKGKEPTRYGDWERNGKCVDF